MGISFVTLLLGLVSGVHLVTVAVTGPVSSVELRLDGRSIGVKREPPWTLRCDLGPMLRPHKLEAVAVDAGGRTLGSCTQWMNLPRRKTEVALSLERDEKGAPAVVHVSWESLEFSKPERIEATLDGAALAVADPSRVELPRASDRSGHVVSVRLFFPRQVEASAELAFGGAIGEETAAELTAVPVVLEQLEQMGKLPAASDMKGWFVAGDRPLSVVGVETGPAEVVIVRDLGAGNLRARWRSQIPVLNHTPGLDSLALQDSVRFLLPTESTQEKRGTQVHLFDISQRFAAADGGIPWILTSFETFGGAERRQSLADAVAVAAVDAAESNRRRAVVLILGTAGRDKSSYTVAAVRAYLRDLRVPLIVWTVEDRKIKGAAAAWREGADAVPILTFGQLEAAVQRLRSALETQALIWVAGKYLPQEIHLAKADLPLRLAGVADTH